MKKLGGVAVALIAIAILVVFVFVPMYCRNKEEAPFASIGPHSMPVRQVSYLAAHGKPIVRFNLPFVGEVVYPKPEPVGFMDPGSEMLAGYVVLTSYRPVMVGDERRIPARTRVVNGKKVNYVPIFYAKSETDREVTVHVDREVINIQAPYDPTKLPARYGREVVQVGPLRIEAELGGIAGPDTFVSMKARMSDPHPTIKIIGPTFKMGSSGGSILDFAAPAIKETDGSLRVEGQLTYSPDGKNEKSYPLSITLKQKPLPK